jgi:hypothetical protein
VDLAYIAREHPSEIDHELVARLVAQKFAHEGGRGRYRELGITGVAQLPGHFTDRRRLDEVMHDRGLGDLFFALAEQQWPEDQTLTSFPRRCVGPRLVKMGDDRGVVRRTPPFLWCL